MTEETPPDDASERVTTLIDSALSAPGTDSGPERYLALVRKIAADDDRDPAWLPWIVGDALSRTVRAADSPFGDRDAQVEVASRAAALAVHHRWREVDDVQLDGDKVFRRIIDGVRTVETDDRDFFERIVEETATVLDEEYVSGFAVLDWQNEFDEV